MVCFAQVKILAACSRQTRGELGPDKRATHCHEAAQHPDAEDQKRRVNTMRHLRRIREDSSAYDTAHHNHDGVEQSKLTARFRRYLVRRARQSRPTKADHPPGLDKGARQSQSSTVNLNGAKRAHMKSRALACRQRCCCVAQARFFALSLAISLGIGVSYAQNEPVLVPDSVDYQKLLPILPDAPQGWSADKAEGSTEDAGGFRITNVHRDYHKGEGENVPTAAISILDSAANPDFEAFEKQDKHATLWIMVANRYFLQIELQNQDPKELQEWVKRVDLKKLAAIN